MTKPDRGADLNPPCTARTGVGVAVVATVAIALAMVAVLLWLR
jgi:hypothetical protein